MEFRTRWATKDDADRIVELLPRLADYELPPGRVAEDFWLGDVELVEVWAQSQAPETVVRVAVDETDYVVAVAIVTYKPDHFSGKPNAHLETIVVHPDADGNGVGRKLIVEMQHEAAKRGALSMSLHVMANNHRARHVYKELGYGEEMIRAIKFLPQ